MENNNFDLSDQAEAGNAGEQPTRNNLTDDDVLEGAFFKVPSTTNQKTSLSPMP